MKAAAISWGSSLLLHLAVLFGLTLVGTSLPDPEQFERFDFALLPNAAIPERPAITPEMPATRPVPRPSKPPQAKVERPKVTRSASQAAKPPAKVETEPVPPEPAERETTSLAEAVPFQAQEPARQLEGPAEPPPPASAPLKKTATPDISEVPMKAPTQQRSLPAQRAKTASKEIQNPAGQPPPAPTALQDYLADRFDYIRDKVLKKLTFPPFARRMGWTGQARVGFLIQVTGKISQVGIEQSTGYPALDRQAVRAIEEAAPFPPPPVAARLNLTINFTLE